MSVESGGATSGNGGTSYAPSRRVCVCEQNAALREALRQVLAADPSTRIVAESATGAACLHQVRSLRPDVAVLDVRMPDMSGLVLAGELRRANPQTKVVVLVTEDARGYHDAAARYGAVCVAKDRLVEGLPAALASAPETFAAAVAPTSNCTAGGAGMNTYLDGRAWQAEAELRERSGLGRADLIACFRPALAVFLIGTLLLAGAVWLSGQAQAYAVEASIVAASDGGGYIVDESGQFGPPGQTAHLSAGQREEYVKRMVSSRRANLATAASIAFAGLVVSSLLIGCHEARERSSGKRAS